MVLLIQYNRPYNSYKYKCKNNLIESTGENNTSILFIRGGFTTPLTSQVIGVDFNSEREKSDKFCSEALISA